MAKHRGRQELAISYIDTRRSIGRLGVWLPIVLVIGVWVLEGTDPLIQPSISDYHGTVMGGVFVGALFAIGVFLYAHIGDESRVRRWYVPTDNIAGNLAGVFALGVALFPNTGGGLVDNVHFVSAVLLFLVLAYHSWKVFPRSEDASSRGEHRPLKREARFLIYRVCAGLMISFLILIALYSWLFDGQGSSVADWSAWSPVFWFEALALWAFGFSWKIYGGTLV